MQTFRVIRLISKAIVSLLFGVWMLVASAQAQAPNDELYILSVTPPAVSVVEAKQFKLLGSISLPQMPSHGVLGPDNRYLYVLMNGALNLDATFPSAPSQLAVVDLPQRKLVQTIPLGWYASRMTRAQDGNYLLCFSPGRAADKKHSREPASLTIVDTRTNEITATLSPGRLGKEILVTRDASRILVLTRAEGMEKKSKSAPMKAALTVFDPGKEQPMAVVELENTPAQMVLSKDEKWLYLLDTGNPSKKADKNRNGAVTVVAVESGKVMGTHDVGSAPRSMFGDGRSDEVAVISQATAKDNTGKLYMLRGNEVARQMDLGKGPLYVQRLANQPGLYVYTYDDLKFVPDQGPAPAGSIPLNGKAVSASGPEAKGLGGFPGETLALPQHNKLAMTVQLSSKVALVNLQTNRIEQTVTTGRGSVKFGQFMGAMALSVAASTASYYAGYYAGQGMGSPYFFYNVYVFSPPKPNTSLAASADGKTLYALNTQTDDVTIIDPAEGKVLGHVAVGMGAQRIFAAATGRLICAQASKQVTLIRTDTNERQTEFKPRKGQIHAVETDASGERILALTGDSLVVWDAKTGEFVAEMTGISEPRMLIQPQAARQ